MSSYPTFTMPYLAHHSPALLNQPSILLSFFSLTTTVFFRLLIRSLCISTRLSHKKSLICP